MKITICGSLLFSKEMEEITKELEKLGHEVILPLSTRKILDGEITVDDIKEENDSGKAFERKLKYDVIRLHYDNIKGSDAILVLNYDKNNITHYIGGNSFLEMGFAHILDKKIFCINPLPDMIYSDELKAFRPVIIDNDLTKIK